MAYFPSLTKPLLAGLDVGTHSIKVLLLGKKRKGGFFVKEAVKRIPEDFRIGEGSDDQLAEWIRELLKAVGFEGRRMASVIFGADSNVQCISLPWMPREELREAVRWEIGKYISFPLEEAKINYRILRETKSEEKKQLHLLVSALPKADMNRLGALMKKAGVQSPLFTPVAGALWNAIQNTKEDICQDTISLIDLGATKTYIMIIRNGIPEFTREIPLAGRHITEAIMELIPPDEKKSISRYEMAERIKFKWGIPSQTNPNGAANGISLERMYVSIRPVLEKLVAEIDRSFEFYRQQFNGSTIEKVYICGGTAKLVNLREYLVSELRLQVEGLETLFDVSCNGDGKIDGVKPELTAAFGVAFEGLGIRSWRFPSIGDFRKKGLLVPLAGVLGIVAAFGMYWNLENRSKVLQMAVEKRRRQVGQLEATMREIVSLRKRRDTLKKELSLYPAHLLKQPPYPDLLMEISHLVPGNVSLDFLMLKGEGNAAEGQDIKGYRLEIKGLIFGKGPERIATIAQLMASLEGSSLFENVRLISTKENNEYSEPGDEFELSCLYRGKE